MYIKSLWSASTKVCLQVRGRSLYGLEDTRFSQCARRDSVHLSPGWIVVIIVVLGEC